MKSIHLTAAIVPNKSHKKPNNNIEMFDKENDFIKIVDLIRNLCEMMMIEI